MNDGRASNRLPSALLLALSSISLTPACGGGDGAPPILAFTPPHNPYLAPTTWPIFHRDSYAQHSSELRAVEGRGQVDFAIVPTQGVPIFTLFDTNGDIVVVVKNLTGGQLAKIDHETLTVLETQSLTGNGVFGGAYGYLDANSHAVVGIGQSVQRWDPATTPMTQLQNVDLAGDLAAGEALAAVSVSYDGFIFFAGDMGTFGVLPESLASGTIDTVTFPGESISNGFTVDEEGGIYLVSSQKLRRLAWNGSALSVAWEYAVGEPYTTPRPGRLGTGSGTTPSLIMDDMVTITDDEQSMNLRVVRRGLDADLGGAPREVCNVPVFDGDATTDNAIVVAGRTLIVEQNLEGHSGVARFDVSDTGCRRTWVAEDVHAPSCVPTLSVPSKLVYVFTQTPDEDWGLTALEVDTGRVRFTEIVGNGIAFDNRYAAMTIGPDERVYVGLISGLAVFWDVP